MPQRCHTTPGRRRPALPDLALALGFALVPVHAAHAALSIVDFYVAAEARSSSSLGEEEVQTLADSQPEALPFVLSAAAQTSSQLALAQQNKAGFFSVSANSTQSQYGGGTQLFTTAATEYTVVVRTDTPDTPLLLNFLFLGSTLYGESYYASGDIRVSAQAQISAGVGARFPSPLDTLPVVWQVGDEVNLRPGADRGLFTHVGYDRDTLGTGAPGSTVDIGWRDFQSYGQVDRGAFNGQLNFGLLQPGEFFTFRYTSQAYIALSDVSYTGRASASLVDPFSLATPPAMQVALEGLALPMAPVPEPSGLALSAIGLAAVVGWAARRRGPKSNGPAHTPERGLADRRPRAALARPAVAAQRRRRGAVRG